jgi:hypothetical protein
MFRAIPGQRAGAVRRATDAKAQFRILAEPFADTGTGRLMLPVPDGLSDVERDLISIRTADGGSRAKARGKHIGGPFPHTGPAERGHQTSRAALEERTRERVPLDWAMTQYNLGNALEELGERESGTGRLEEAVAAFNACLTITESVWPREWLNQVRERENKSQAEIKRRAGK